MQTLKAQLEEQREKARKEVQEAQRNGNGAQSELEKSNLNLRRLEEEVCILSACVCSLVLFSFFCSECSELA